MDALANRCWICHTCPRRIKKPRHHEINDDVCCFEKNAQHTKDDEQIVEEDKHDESEDKEDGEPEKEEDGEPEEKEDEEQEGGEYEEKFHG